METGRALVDVESGELKFSVNEDEVIFKVCKSMNHQININVISIDDVIDEAVVSVRNFMRMSESHEAVTNCDDIDIHSYK